ncbi:MAG: BlaI/MecI/CopY family transcriptional regulator [Planctomycetales bacterium]|nr:BlaI/MecI/CopY family transcriptional regulator [Planctomycetales bacterium]
MPRSEPERPTELELEILKVLWRDSPLPVRDVRSRLETDAGRPLAHSTVITMLNIMHRKGFLNRRKVGNAFHFSPKVEKTSVTGRMMGDLLSRAFDGSPAEMVLNLLETTEIDPDEMAELRRMINCKSKELES